MTPLEIGALAAAGVIAGGLNAIVGSGSFVAFPTLLALGYSPVVANVTNRVGLVLGLFSGVAGYRRELSGQRERVLLLGVPTLVGAAVGAALLLVLPPVIFQRVAPALIIIAIGLMLGGPRISRALEKRSDAWWVKPALPASIFLTAIYGGYFGAAMGVILISTLNVMVEDSLQRLNGLKNVLAGLISLAAAVYFIIFAHVAWEAAIILAGSSIVGGWLGASVGRRLSPTVLKWIIVVGGIAAVVKLVL
ncbi:MAG: sulfite exporter TauE/SafE family protein [Candidatus Dormibacterales bacterium]